ncbi:MAG: hypothetical protein GVY36_17000 [Verrucomicrobia bacterium]|jgi:hypothetical protein|nr:hypothetical protein [Verrucomicrobiota bacterium]
MNIKSIESAVTENTPNREEILAACLYLKRRDREAHPEGYFDKAGRWYSSGRDAEVMTVCRLPSRAWPLSEMHACRALCHCARYHDADELKTRRITNAIEHLVSGKKLTKPAEQYVELIRVVCTTVSI